MWYNLRNPIIQSYLTGYEQTNRDIEIEEEKVAKIKSEQLEELRRKEKKVPGMSVSRKRTRESSAGGGALARTRPYQMA